MRGIPSLVALLALVAVSCGSPSMSEEAADALQGHMTDLRSAVEQQRPQRAEAALDKLRAEARKRADEGEITGDRLAQIEGAAAQVEGFLGELDTQPPPEPDPEPEREDNDDEEDKDDDEKDKDDDKERKDEDEKEDKDEGAGGGGDEPGDGGPGTADEEEPGDGGQTDGAPAGEDETDTARAAWTGWWAAPV